MIYHGHKPELTIWKGNGTGFKRQLLTELDTYARGLPPYNQQVTEAHDALHYWKLLVGRKSATILPVSRIYVPRAYENLFTSSLVSCHKTLCYMRELYGRRTDSVDFHLDITTSPSSPFRCIDDCHDTDSAIPPQPGEGAFGSQLGK